MASENALSCVIVHTVQRSRSTENSIPKQRDELKTIQAFVVSFCGSATPAAELRVVPTFECEGSLSDNEAQSALRRFLIGCVQLIGALQMELRTITEGSY